MPEKEIRQLSAVMFTDIAGYTAMVQVDEAAALEKVSRYRQVLQECTDKYGGKVIAFYGDGSLSIYPSASNAVRCAIDMQSGYREALPVHVPVRIGLHLGDIVLKDETVYGDGVNVASRIEAQGVPGAILVSGKIQRELKNQGDIQTTFLGAYDLKNVRERIDVYAVTNEGLVIPPKPKKPQVTRKRLRIAGIAVLLLFLAGYFLGNSGILPFLNFGSDAIPIEEERVAILFEDFVLSESLKQVPVMTSMILIDDLREIPNAKVISYESALQQSEELRRKSNSDVLLANADYARFADRTGAVNLLRGMVRERGDSLEFRASLFDLSDPDDEIQHFEKVVVPKSNPNAGIERLGNAIRGFWASRHDRVLTIPNMESYTAYLNARKVWVEDNALAVERLERSIVLDSAFMDPYFMLASYYINTCAFDQAQEYLNLIRENFDGLTKRHKNLLNFYQADINGQCREAFELYQEELAIDPKDQFVNSTAMFLASEYVHQANKVIEYFDLIPIDSLDITDCTYCLERYLLAIDAHLQLENIDQARTMAEKIPVVDAKTMRAKMDVFTAVENDEFLELVIDESIKSALNDRWYPYYYLARRYLLLGDSTRGIAFANRALDTLSNIPRGNEGWGEVRWDYSAMKTHYLLSNFEEARRLVDPIVSDFPQSAEARGFKGLIAAGSGQSDMAREVIDQLDDARPCRRGEILYHKATILAQLGETDAAFDMLRDATENGMYFLYDRFENDPALIPLIDDPRFNEILYPVVE